MTFIAADLAARLRVDGKDAFDRALADSGTKYTALRNIAQKAGDGIAATFRVAAAAASTVALAATGLAVSTFTAASRVQELDTAMRAVGKSTGVGYDAINKTAIAVKNQGIEMATAQQLAIQFAQANLSLADASKVARVAQDLAVIAGQNSTVETANLLGAVVSQNSEMLRSAGITASASQGYQEYANAIGVSVQDLTDMQKKQAIVNLILEQGAAVAGTYEAAMQDAYKVIGSMPRILNDVAVSLGGPLLSAFGPAIVQTYDLMKAFDAATSTGGSLSPLIEAVSHALTELATPLTASIGKLTTWVNQLTVAPATIQKVTDFIDHLAGKGPQLAAFGAVVATLGASQIPILGKFLPGINPLLAGFAALVATSPALRGALGGVFSDVKAQMPQLTSAFSLFMGQVEGSLVPALVSFIGALEPALPALAELATKLLLVAGSAAPAAVNIFTDLLHIALPLVQAIADLPTPTIALVAALVGLNAAGIPVTQVLGQVGGAMLKVAGNLVGLNTGIPSFATALGGITGAAGGVTGKLGGLASFIGGPWGLAIGGAITVLGTLALSAMPQAAANTDQLRDSFDKLTGAMTDNTRASVFNQLETDGTIKKAKALGLSAKDVVDAALGQADAIDKVAAAAGRAQEAYDKASHSSEGVSGTLTGLAQDALDVSNAINGQATAVAEGAKKAQDWLNVNTQSRVAQNDLKKAVDDTNTSLKQNGVSTDETSAAYQANLTALDTLGKKAADYVSTVQNQYRSTKQTVGATEDAIRAVYGAATQMGLTGAAAAKYTGKLLGIPTWVVTQFEADTSQATASVSALLKLYNTTNAAAALSGARYAGQAAQYANGKKNADGGLYNYTAFADGGIPSGIYAGRPGGIYKFAEPETGWEAFISGKAGMESRNRSILADAAQRLGMEVVSGGGSRATGASGSFAGTVGGSSDDRLVAALTKALKSVGIGMNLTQHLASQYSPDDIAQKTADALWGP